jgi:hypothetical protein
MFSWTAKYKLPNQDFIAHQARFLTQSFPRSPDMLLTHRG